MKTFTKFKIGDTVSINPKWNGATIVQKMRGIVMAVKPGSPYGPIYSIDWSDSRAQKVVGQEALLIAPSGNN